MNLATAQSFREVFDALDITDDTSIDDAYLLVTEAGLGDGLPVIPPAPSRVEAMLTGWDTTPETYVSPPLFPSFMAPMFYDVAIHAVMAGARRQDLPVIVAALVAMAEDDYNLLGIQATTGSATPVVVVHGDIARELGIQGGANCMGQGNRANATIGRAIRLVLQNVGMAIPGVTDMATLGQPGKFGWCFTENVGESPLPPYHTTRGFGADESAVTVMAVSGSQEVVLTGSYPRDYASCFAQKLGPLGTGQVMVVLPPEAANQAAGEGWDRARYAEAIIESLLAGGRPHAAEDLLFMVAGGVGIKAALLPGWGASSLAVTKPVLPL